VSEQTAADYRKRAAECVAIASKSSNPEARAQFVMLAQQWAKLADQHQQFERRRHVGGTGPP
jgi:hypothetical protein